jgi:hypothetical protein
MSRSSVDVSGEAFPLVPGHTPLHPSEAIDVGLDCRTTEVDDLKARAVHDHQGIPCGRFAGTLRERCR